MLNKLQTTLVKMKLKALLNSKGEGSLKGLTFRVGSKTLTIGEVRLRTNLPLLELNLDSIESLEFNHKEYELLLTIKDLKIVSHGEEFSVEELTIESFTELNHFVMDLKGIIKAME